MLAIIITIMVLELRAPAGDTFAALWHAAGTGLFSYLLSFVYVGIYYVLQAVIIGSQGRDSVLRKAVGRDVKGTSRDFLSLPVRQTPINRTGKWS